MRRWKNRTMKMMGIQPASPNSAVYKTSTPAMSMLVAPDCWLQRLA
jgi:hypothetical protein